MLATSLICSTRAERSGHRTRRRDQAGARSGGGNGENLGGSTARSGAMNFLPARNRHRRNPALDDSGSAEAACRAGSAGRDTANVDATPRRLVVQAEGVPERTPDEQQMRRRVRRSSAGERAAAGFAKKQGVIQTALNENRQSITSFRRMVPGRAASDILAEPSPPRSSGLWPKTMYWTGEKRPALYPPHPLDRRAAGRRSHSLRNCRRPVAAT